MRNWVLRGLVFAAAMLAVRLVQGVLLSTFPTHAGLISVALLVIFALVVAVWSVRDGRDDAAANPDPDRRGDLAMTWLLAGLVAGALSGAVSWVIAWFVPVLYSGGFVSEISTLAAFTALLVFLCAVAGVALGRQLLDR